MAKSTQTDCYRTWVDETSPPANDAIVTADNGVAESEESAGGQENSISVHLMSVSAGMVGVCLTVIGLFRFMQNQNGMATVADDLVAIDSILFVLVCLVSYCAMRTLNARKRQRLDRVADALFLAALCFMAIICSIIAWTIA